MGYKAAGCFTMDHTSKDRVPGIKLFRVMGNQNFHCGNYEDLMHEVSEKSLPNPLSSFTRWWLYIYFDLFYFAMNQSNLQYSNNQPNFPIFERRNSTSNHAFGVQFAGFLGPRGRLGEFSAHRSWEEQSIVYVLFAPRRQR